MTELKSEYRPDSVSPPGETLLETLEEQGMTQAELAKRMGRPKKTINEIIKGKTAITPETALQLELVLGIPASFWNKRERRYHEAIVRNEQDDRLAQWTDWLDKVPYRELISHGWIQDHSERVDLLREVLSFFGVVSPSQWEVLWSEKVDIAFRKSKAYSTDEVALATWLRRSELKAHEVDCAAFDESGFREVLQDVRALTRKRPSPELYQRDLLEVCREFGVAVALVPRLSASRAFGASEWLSPQKALIAISLYYKTDDLFWFTFFHEAAHILLHSKKDVFIDEQDEEGGDVSQIEAEADRFAADLLISPDLLQHFVQSVSHTGDRELFFGEAEICSFAADIGVAPSIVVGRLQHDGFLGHRFRNELKTYLEWGAAERVTVKKIAKIYR